MKKEKELLKNTTILTVGKVCTQMITFLLLPLYTTFLSTAEYGVVDLLTALVSLALPIITLQIEHALFRRLIDFRNDEKEDNKIEYITTAFFSIIVQIAIFGLVFLVISPLINNKYKYLLALNICAYVFATLFQQIARGLGKNKEYAIGSSLSAIGTIIFNVLFLIIFNLGVYGMLYGVIIGQIICSLYLCIKLNIIQYIKIEKYNLKFLRTMLGYSLPLIPNNLSWWIFNTSDRIIISYKLGVDQNGILSVAHKFSTIIVFLLNIYNMSWTESISVHINDADFKDFFCKMLDKSMRIFSSLSMGIIICMPVAFPILINGNFNQGFFQIPILIIASIFMTFISLIGALYLAKKNTKAVAITSIVSAILNLVINLSLINHVGLYAATISTLAAYVIMSIYRYFDIKHKYFKLKISKEYLLKTALSFSIVTIIYYFKNLYLNIIMFIVGIIYCIDINKDVLNYILSYLKERRNRLC